jgi:cytochrome c-type biogenesis protein CcmE
MIARPGDDWMDMVNHSRETTRPKSVGRVKFLIGGLLIIAAVVYLVVSSLQSSSQYFLTVEELQSKGSAIIGRDVKLSGPVIGNSITYDAQTLTLRFTIANIPGDQKEVDAQGGLAAVLHAAVVDPDSPQVEVVYVGVKPDLLRNEAQAIVTGRLGEDGVFHASELLLKCPTRYEDALPQQSAGQ